jgi:hypothetical protein
MNSIQKKKRTPWVSLTRSIRRPVVLIYNIFFKTLGWLKGKKRIKGSMGFAYPCQHEWNRMSLWRNPPGIWILGFPWGEKPLGQGEGSFPCGKQDLCTEDLSLEGRSGGWGRQELRGNGSLTMYKKKRKVWTARMGCLVECQRHWSALHGWMLAKTWEQKCLGMKAACIWQCVG